MKVLGSGFLGMPGVHECVMAQHAHAGIVSLQSMGAQVIDKSRVRRCGKCEFYAAGMIQLRQAHIGTQQQLADKTECRVAAEFDNAAECDRVRQSAAECGRVRQSAAECGQQ